MRFFVALRSTLVGALALLALAGEAVSLPGGMTLPATYRMRGTMTVVMVARVRGQSRTFTRSGPARDTLTLGDGTFAFERMVGDGSPATGTWTETDTNVLTRTYDAGLDERVASGLEAQIRSVPGFRNADATCTTTPRAVTVRRGGNRLTGSDRVKFRVTNGAARMSGSLLFRWTGRRTD